MQKKSKVKEPILDKKRRASENEKILVLRMKFWIRKEDSQTWKSDIISQFLDEDTRIRVKILG